MLHVASVCTPCCMLLDAVGSCCAKLETGQTSQPTTPNISFVPWSPKRSATMLNPFGQLFQHCWGHARSLRMDYEDLWVVFFPRCTVDPNIVGSCCIRLHTTANTHAITPNIVGATMLGVVASVFTQPYCKWMIPITCLFDIRVHMLSSYVVPFGTLLFLSSTFEFWVLGGGSIFSLTNPLSSFVSDRCRQ